MIHISLKKKNCYFSSLQIFRKNRKGIVNNFYFPDEDKKKFFFSIHVIFLYSATMNLLGIM